MVITLYHSYSIAKMTQNIEMSSYVYVDVAILSDPRCNSQSSEQTSRWYNICNLIIQIDDGNQINYDQI
jgi:hypothetical protein